jgi:putative hydrolase of the HAD superfamily
MSRWQAVVFDLDDTLYPERDYVLSGFRAVATWAAQNLGFPAERNFDDLRYLYDNGERGHTFDRWLEGHGYSEPNLVEQLVRVYRDHEPALTAFTDVPPLLQSLRRHYRLGLLSDGYLAVQKRKWAALGLAAHFDVVVFSDTWGRRAWKPSLRPYEEVLKLLSCPPGAVIYIGDNPLKDFIGARRMGMKTIRVRRPGGVYADEEPPSAAYQPHHEIVTLAEVEALLLGEGWPSSAADLP